MRYTVRHVTRFTYEPAVTESVMEVRMQPRSDAQQRCLHFALTTTPVARVMTYQDHDGNSIHHFDIPARHSRMTVTAEALVECTPARPLAHRLGPGAWEAIDRAAHTTDVWDYLAPSRFTGASELLDRFALDVAADRSLDPLVALRRLMGEIYIRFEYSPNSTRVDSPIDHALESKRGVCQDFTHIFIAAARRLGIPTRYVSGYLFPDPSNADRSIDGATHAWAESLLPETGWVGFDPTNNLIADERHIRVAVGRDYADVPPTRGVYKGASAVKSELAVAVRVGPARLAIGEIVPFIPWMSRDASLPLRDEAAEQQQQ
jgi:transglutaminase-like putative cysteine protease